MDGAKPNPFSELYAAIGTAAKDDAVKRKALPAVLGQINVAHS